MGKRTGAEKFLDEQDRRRQAAFERNNSRIRGQQAARDAAFVKAQSERDQRIADDMAERDWQRRNDEHKKSVFYAELQQARVEGRPSIYGTFTDVPDMERPSAPQTPTSRFAQAASTGSSLLLVFGIAVAVVVAAVITAWRMFGDVFGQLFVLLLVAYAVMTVVWLIKRYALTATTPDEIAAAEKWNPITNTLRCVRYVRGRIRGSRE